MSRSCTDTLLCSFEETWKEDREFKSFGITYTEGNAPIKSSIAPSWYTDGSLDTALFFGRIFHEYELTATGTEKYRFGGTSEHTPEDLAFTVTETWTAKDFDHNVIFGPTTVSVARTFSQISVQFPFLFKSHSLSIGATVESSWFSFRCGEAGEHTCSAISWFGKTLEWPALNFSESYDFIIVGGFFDGTRVHGAVNLTSGGSISCGCDGGYERDSLPRLASYHVGVGIYGEGPLSVRVKCDPVDLDGARVAGKKGFVLFGPLYTSADPSGTFAPVDYSSYTGDVSDYAFERSLPLDETFHFPVRRVRDNARVIVSGNPVYWPGLPSNPERYKVDHHQVLRSQLTTPQVVLDRESFFGLPAAPRLIANFALTHPGTWVLHRFHPEAEVTAREVATIQQPAAIVFPGQPFTWTANNPSDGTVAIDGADTVFEITASSATFSRSFGSVKARPYRYIVFDYEIEDGGTVGSTWDVTDDLVTKRFTTSLKGSGTGRVDLCYPRGITTEIPGQGATLLASRLTTENQGEGLALRQRFSGVREIASIQLRLSGPSTIRIRNVRLVAESGEIRLGGWSQLKTDIATFVSWGALDHKDAWRLRLTSTTTPQSFLTGLGTNQQMTVNHGSYALPSTWLSPTSINGISDGARGDGGATFAGYFSWFGSDMSFIGPKNALSPVSARVTLGAISLKIYTGCGQDDMIPPDVADDPFLLQCEAVVGSFFSATAFRFSKKTKVAVKGTSALGTIDEEYETSQESYGHLALPIYRPSDTPTDPVQIQNLEHFVPKHPEPQQKQLVYATGARNVFWIGVSGVHRGQRVSYDVSKGIRHFRAFVEDDGSIWTGYAGNDLEFTDRDSGLTGESICLRVEKGVGSPRLFLWIESETGHIARYDSTDEGANWTMALDVADGIFPAVEIALNNRQYVYWMDAGDVKGKIYDAADNILEPEFLVLPGADEDGLAIRESVKRGGRHRLVLMVRVGGVTRKYESPDGIVFA